MRRVLAAAAFVLGTGAGCAAVIGADFNAHLAAVSEAGVDGEGPDAGDSGPGTCTHALPPGRPSVNGGGDIEFWTALYTIDYGDNADAAATIDFGFDVDRACTRAPFSEPPTCLRPKDFQEQEGNDGRDDEFGALLRSIKILLGPGGNLIGGRVDTSSIQDGVYSAAIHVSGYNGQADDDQVTVEWKSLAPFYSDKDGSSSKPAWDGTDEWPARIAVGVDAGSAGDTRAYVAGNILVATLPRGTQIASPTLQIDLTGVFITGRIVKGPAGYELDDGAMGGLWRSDQILNAFNLLLSANNFCTIGAGEFGNLHGLICKDLDVTSQTQAGPTEPCDSVSLGAAYSTKPIRPVVNLSPFVPPEAGCSGIDPALLVCDGG